jgi:hypothetical protein
MFIINLFRDINIANVLYKLSQTRETLTGTILTTTFKVGTEGVRLRLVREMKNFRCHIGCVGGCREGFLNTHKKNKLQNPSRNCKTNLMILINPLLAHAGYGSI